MGIIDFKVDFSNQKVLGAIVRCFLDIPRWLKILVVLSFVGAIVYFGFCQGYLYKCTGPTLFQPARAEGRKPAGIAAGCGDPAAGGHRISHRQSHKK